MSTYCGVQKTGETTVCGAAATEDWDAPGMVEDVNQSLKDAEIEFQMTTPVICDEHMWMCPEV